MRLPALQDDDFIRLGLKQMGFSEASIQSNSAERNLNRFKDFYYASPKTVAQIMVDIQADDLGDACIAKPNPLLSLPSCTIAGMSSSGLKMVNYLNLQ